MNKKIKRIVKYVAMSVVTLFCLFIFDNVAFADDNPVITFYDPTNPSNPDFNPDSIPVGLDTQSVSFSGTVHPGTLAEGDKVYVVWGEAAFDTLEAAKASTNKVEASGNNFNDSISTSGITFSSTGNKVIYFSAYKENSTTPANDALLGSATLTLEKITPELSVSDVTVDLDYFSGTINLNPTVTNANTKTKIAYTFDTLTDAEFLNNIPNNGRDYANNSLVVLSANSGLDKLYTDAASTKKATIYLYRDDSGVKEIYDKKTVNILRSSKDIDNTGAFYLVNSDGETVTNLTIDKNTSSVNGKIGLSTEVFNNYYRPKYRVVSQDGSDVSCNGGWDYSSGNPRCNITISNLNGMSATGNNYTVWLEYNYNSGNYGQDKWIKVKTMNFSVLYKQPELTWDYDNYDRENKTIPFPIVNSDLEDTNLHGHITACEPNDKLMIYTGQTAPSDLSTWAVTADKYDLTNDSTNRVKKCKVEVPLSVFPYTVEPYSYKFYLYKDASNLLTDESQIVFLGDYTIDYANPENHFSPYEGSAQGYDSDRDEIYNIQNVNYYFAEATYASDSATTASASAHIYGYYTYGMTEQVIWSFDAPSASITEEGTCDTSPVVNTNPGGYHNNYHFDINNLELTKAAEDEPYEFTNTIYLYIKRGTDYIPLGSVIVKPAFEPELYDINIDGHSFWGNRYINISCKANDYNTGVSRIYVVYRRNGIDLTEDLYVNNLNTFAPGVERTGSKIFFELSEREEKTLKIVVKNLNGKTHIYDKAYVNRPEISLSAYNSCIEVDGREKYYASQSKDNVSFTVNIKMNRESTESNNSTEVTTLSSSRITISTDSGSPKVINKTYSTTTVEDNITINMNDSTFPTSSNGKYTISVWTRNDKGNEDNYEFKYSEDTTAPTITKFEVGNEVFDLNSNYNNPNNYIHATQSSAQVKVYARDAASGVKSIQYYWRDKNGNNSPVDETPYQGNQDENDEVFVGVARSTSFRGYLYARATDMVGNVSEYVMLPGGIIVDLAQTHSSEEHIEISYAATNAKDKNGHPIFNKATDITIKVTDMHSGVNSVSYNVVVPNNNNANQSGGVTVNESGDLNGNSWAKISSDENIVTSVSRKITVGENCDNIVLHVEMTDKAGNSSTKELTFSIDTVKPTVSVSYGNQTGDSEFTNYYADSRTATIVVKERNFDVNSANAIIQNSVGNKGSLSSWKENRDANNPDNTTYTATVTFEKDDRYILTYKVKDLAENSSDEVKTPEFVIDKIKPEIAIAFDYSSGKNNYYSDARKATVTVKDANFEPKRLSLAGVRDGGYSVSSWTRKDNTYSAVITFDKDGEYVFDATVTDKAGNKGNSVHVSKFVVDQTSPNVEIDGVKDKAAYKGDVTPKIVFSDKYIEKDSIQIELVGAKNGKINLDGKYTVSEDGLTYLLKNIENKKENDDLYTLKITVKDMAGNVTKEEIVFSVNRFGSYYVFGDKLKNINDKYAKKAEGIEITEINVNKIKSRSITLTVNGVPKTLVEGVDFKVVSEEKEADWKQYKYVFVDSLFEKDGSYIISIASEDEAGNKNNSDNEEKESEIKFGVDATAPIVATVNFEANSYYSSNGIAFFLIPERYM